MLCEFEKLFLVELEKRYNFEYLRPPREVYNIHIAEDEYFTDMDTKEPRRKIYYNVPFNPDELKTISEVKVELQKHGIHQKISDELILKHIYMTKWAKDKVVTRLKDVINYHRNPVITTFTDETIKKLNSGFCYTYGYDRRYKPIIVLRADRIDFKGNFQETLNAYYYFMLMIYHYRMVPYHAEKILFIIDFGSVSLTSLPILSLFEQFKKVGICYCGVTEKTILFNASSLGWIWKIISGFMNETQKRKIMLIKAGQEEKMLEFVDPDQLQKKYGGNVEQIQEYWPPKDSNERGESKLNRMESRSSEYFSVDNNFQYFQQSSKEHGKGGCCGGGCACDIY